jgi:hypothetical protein
MFILDCKGLPLLCGKDMLEEWNISMNMRDGMVNFIDESMVAFCEKDSHYYLLALYPMTQGEYEVKKEETEMGRPTKISGEI